MSDLHLEFAPFQPNKVDADVVVLAGDVHTGTNGIKWILEAFRDKPVIYVLGNHEFYGQKIQKLIASIKEIAQGTNVHVLDNDRVGSTRVIANPRRCPTEPHIGFDPALVIEV
ncbi:MAG TPA: metallophosphoesterase [Candidatus Paceibacterota bacterium]|nr:metallophosphoesterase [Candidatus Paceibacterota bacterium]